MIFSFLFFHSFECNHLDDSSLDLNEVAYHDEPSQIYLGSPSIVRLSTGRLVASHDFFGIGYNGQPRNASVYVSDDNGETWTFSSYIKHSYWTTLAVYNNVIYAIGTTSDSNAHIIIHRSSDNGASWNYNGDDEGVVLFNGSFATGATPIVIANKVMYRGIEAWTAPSRWPDDFHAAIISCDLSKSNGLTDDDPIMSPSHWRLTPPLPFDRNWIPKSFPNISLPGYLEGNVVIAPKPSSTEFRVLNILRFNSAPLNDLAVILELNQTTNTLSFVSFINFPGGNTKFSIRYDPITQTYFSLINTQLRNVLGFSYTKDLLNLSKWIVAEDRLLYDDTGLTATDSRRYTGFQYVDWQFDNLTLPLSDSKASCIEWDCDGGPHIIYLIRTGYRGANSFHNSNRITYKVLRNYRKFIR